MSDEGRIDRLEKTLLAVVDALKASWGGDGEWQSYWDVIHEFEEEMRGFRK